MSDSYSKRESVLEKGTRVWRIEPDALVHVFSSGGQLRLPWEQVRRVRLRYAPTEIKRWRYIFTIDGPGAKGMSFDNGHYISVGNFEDRSVAFSAFVDVVLEKVAERAPAAKLYLGASPLNYAALMASMMIPMAFLCWVILTIPSDWTPGGLVWMRLALIAAMLPVAGLWMVKSWPRQADMAKLRENLPGAPADG